MSNSAAYSLPPTEGFVVTHFITVADVNRSAEFYVRIARRHRGAQRRTHHHPTGQ